MRPTVGRSDDLPWIPFGVLRTGSLSGGEEPFLSALPAAGLAAERELRLGDWWGCRARPARRALRKPQAPPTTRSVRWSAARLGSHQPVTAHRGRGQSGSQQRAEPHRPAPRRHLRPSRSAAVPPRPAP